LWKEEFKKAMRAVGRRLYSLSQKITAANNEALARMGKADIVLEDLRPARELIPALADPTRKLVLISGPPVTWKNMGNAQKGAVAGICIFEVWCCRGIMGAAADARARDGPRRPRRPLRCATAARSSSSPTTTTAGERQRSVLAIRAHLCRCGPMAGTITASFPVYVVRNTAFGNTAFSRPADLSQQFGDYRDIGDIMWWRDGVAPYLGQVSGEMVCRNVTHLH
jgi:hypothetical protein